MKGPSVILDKPHIQRSVKDPSVSVVQLVNKKKKGK